MEENELIRPNDIYFCHSTLFSVSKGQRLKYRLISIDFDPKQTSTLGPRLMNVEIQRREANFILFSYRKIMSFIFLVASVITMILYSCKIYTLAHWSEVGALKGLVFINLVILVMYNFLYSIGTRDHWASNFLDDLINSVMMSSVLFLNLVLLDAQTYRIERTSGSKRDSIWHKWATKLFSGRCSPAVIEAMSDFILPKLLICLGISIALHFLMFTHNARLVQYITRLS